MLHTAKPPHTTEPWCVDTDGTDHERGGAAVIRSGRWVVASIARYDSMAEEVPSDAEMAAARLIAAAPDMLTALITAAAHMPRPDHTGQLDAGAARNGIAIAVPLAHNTCACALHRAHKAMHAAIAKARG